MRQKRYIGPNGVQRKASEESQKNHDKNLHQRELEQRIKVLQKKFKVIAGYSYEELKKERVEKVKSILEEANSAILNFEFYKAEEALNSAEYYIRLMSILIEAILFVKSIFSQYEELNIQYNNSLKMDVHNRVVAYINSDSINRLDVVERLEKENELDMLRTKYEKLYKRFLPPDYTSPAFFRLRMLNDNSSWEEINSVKCDLLAVENDALRTELRRFQGRVKEYTHSGRFFDKRKGVIVCGKRSALATILLL